MDNIFIFWWMLLAWIFASYLWMYISGWISSLSMLFLIWFWLSPNVANSTYQIWNLCSNFGWIKYFLQSNNYKKQHILPMFLIMLVCWYIGSLFLVDLEERTVFRVLGCIYLFLAWVELFNIFHKTEFSKSLGSASKTYLWYLLVWITSIWAVIFPAGNGVFFYQIYTKCFGMTPLMTKWHQKLVINGLFIWAFPNMIAYGIFHPWYALWFGLWMYIWGHIWAKHVIKAGNNILQRTIIIWMVLVWIYFLFWK